MLIIDNSSAFNTIVPSKLIIKLEALGLNPALCNWVLGFLTGRPQVVKIGPPFPSMGQQWTRWTVLSSSAYTSQTN